MYTGMALKHAQLFFEECFSYCGGGLRFVLVQLVPISVSDSYCGGGEEVEQQETLDLAGTFFG